MARYRINKLVREKIADFFEEHGPGTERETLSGMRLLDAILDKIDEERAEIAPDSPPKEQEREMSDLLQAIEDYVAVAGLDRQRIEALKQRRLEEKGGFASGDFLSVVGVEDDSHWDEYFANDPRVERVEE